MRAAAGCLYSANKPPFSWRRLSYGISGSGADEPAVSQPALPHTGGRAQRRVPWAVVSEAHLWEELASWTMSIALWCILAVAYSYIAVTEWRGWRRRRAAGRPPRGEGPGDAGARR